MYVACIYPPVQIPAFYSKYRSLYDDVYVLLSKWPAFYSEFIVWVRTHAHRPVRPSGGGGGLHV